MTPSLVLTFASSMALEDYIRETRALIKSFRDQADTLEKQLQATLSLLSAGVLKEEQRKPTTWKPADDIQRILDYGKKTMLRNELIQSRREQAGGRRRGGRSTAPPVCYRGYTPWPRRGYLSENGDGTVHWVPGKRKSRVAKKR